MTSPRLRVDPLPTPRPRGRALAVRRPLTALLAVLAPLLVLGIALAGPAAAEVPAEGWPEREPVGLLFPLLLIGGVTLLLMLVITVMVLGPAIARGERIVPGAAPVQDQWLGGPRRSAGELAAPDTENSQAGGAGARW